MAMQGVYQSRASAGLQSLPAGYMEAATAPGRHLAAGISKFGESMGEAIESYKKGKAQSEYLDKEFELLQEDLDEITGASGAGSGDVEGWGAAFDESYQQNLAKDIAKFSEMGLSQKKAKIADLKFDIDRFYKERDFNQKKSQFDQQFKQQSEQFDKQFDLQDRVQELRENQFEETKRSNLFKEEKLTDEIRIAGEAQQLQAYRAQEAADRAAADKEAYGIASGAIPIGESGYAPESPQGKAWTPKNRALQAAGSPEAAWRISQMKAAAPTMGQNVAAARQLFTQGAGINPRTGLPFDEQELLTQAINLYGADDKTVDAINATHQGMFGAAEPKIGDVMEVEGKKYIRTSKGQIQALPGQEAGDSISPGILDAAGDSLTRWLGGSDAGFHEGARAIAEKDRKLLPEFYKLRQEANKAYRQDKMANLPATDVQRINTQERMIRILSDQLATAEADEVPGLQKQISDAEKSIKAVVDKHIARQGKLQDAARGGGGTGMPTSVYTPGGKFKKVK